MMALRIGPAHEFCVAELGETTPGSLDASLALLRPSIGIVTLIGDDHLSAFGSREAIAREMTKLVASLPASGTAVLNADDELVIAMAAQCRSKILSYGLSKDANLRAEDISSVWPERLEFVAIFHAQRVKVRTRLCGTHWVPSVLGAIGGGLAAGLSLDECAQGIADVAPFEGRMQPVTTADGVTFIRDDFKASLWTIDASLEFMRTAQAKRKFIVFGTISDCGPGTPQKHARVARQAQEIVDETIFVGKWGTYALKAQIKGHESALRIFGHARDAAAYLEQNLQRGDLVMLKGTNPQDHLARIILHRTEEIACWRGDCKRTQFCTECPDRMKPSGASISAGPTQDVAASAGETIPELDPVNSREVVIVGLGNPGSQYAGTPHNIGYKVVDLLAESMGARWMQTPRAWIARGTLRGQRMCLLKLRVAMNLIGAPLFELSRAMSFGPDQCILAFDDLDTPLGSIRNRLSGGAGGHRGVASILEAFQTDALPRIKVGVGCDDATRDRVRYVLTPFEQAARILVDQSVRAAVDRAIEMCGRRQAEEATTLSG